MYAEPDDTYTHQTGETMATITVREGTVIARRNRELNQIFIITAGTVTATYEQDVTLLGKGDVIGLLDLDTGYYTYEYVASGDVTLLVYPCKTCEDACSIVSDNGDIAGLFATSLTRSICHIIDNYIMLRYNIGNLYGYLIDSYDTYKKACMTHSIPTRELPMDDLKPLDEMDDVPSWIVNYYEAIKVFDTDLSRVLFIDKPDFFKGFLHKACADAGVIFESTRTLLDYQNDISTVMLNPNHVDMFDLFTTLVYRMISTHKNTMSIHTVIGTFMIQMEGTVDPVLYQERVAEYRTRIQALEQETPGEPEPASPIITGVQAALSHSLDTILEYSDCLPDTASAFRQAVYEYKDIVDKTASTESLTELRKKITNLFFEIYTSAFQISLTDPNIPPVLKMFFEFGYVDEELAGPDAAAYLYDLVQTYHGDPDHGVYTLYEWLIQVYKGRKEPSRNEFDVDFTQYVHELKTSGRITDEISRRMMNDTTEKVMYELQNMFPMVNKIAFGRISTYCPVFSEHNLYKSVESQLMKPEAILASISKVRSIDYSVFYRESLYSNSELGIGKELLQTEVLPDVILMPVVGSRGIMWQEIEGKRRSTPARMMIPILYPEDVDQLMIRLAGEYRWEMCKRVQGTRWNDVSDPSLTSEYFDYIQFYRKNSELSKDVKEKIKITLQKTKGSYREAFVRDYIAWITLEGKGSPVLNKVTRRILFRYCPFSAGIRTQLETNPLYKESLDRYNIRKAQYDRQMENIFTKLKNAGKQIPGDFFIDRELAGR